MPQWEAILGHDVQAAGRSPRPCSTCSTRGTRGGVVHLADEGVGLEDEPSHYLCRWRT